MSEARLPIHPYAAIFPAITSPDFDHLCGAIARQGLLQEIILHEGKVLDGWHRTWPAWSSKCRHACVTMPGSVAPRFISCWPRTSTAAT